MLIFVDLSSYWVNEHYMYWDGVSRVTTMWHGFTERIHIYVIQYCPQKSVHLPYYFLRFSGKANGFKNEVKLYVNYKEGDP